MAHRNLYLGFIVTFLSIVLCACLAMSGHSGEPPRRKVLARGEIEKGAVKADVSLVRISHDTMAAIVKFPKKSKAKIQKIELISPSGRKYKAGELRNLPSTDVKDYIDGLSYNRRPSGRFFSSVGRLFMEEAHATCGTCGDDGGGSGETKPKGRTASDGETAAAYGAFTALLGTAVGGQWYTVGTFRGVTEEAGKWEIIITFEDEGKRQSIKTGLDLKERPAAAAGETRAESYDPETGLKTSVVLNTDGSTTKTVTDRSGRTVSSETRPPAKGAARTFLDPDTGLRITETDNPDGSVTRHAEDKDGNWSEGHYYPGGKKEEVPEEPPPLTPEKEEPALTPEKEEPPLTPEKEEPTLTPEKEEEPPPLTPEKEEPHPCPGETVQPEGEKPTEPRGPFVPAGPVVVIGVGTGTLPPEEDESGLPLGVLLVRDDDAWIPEYAGTTTVTASIYYKPAGSRFWKPSKQKRLIIVRFVERSNEPGMCVNKKLPQDPQDTPDLFFEESKNPDAVCSNDPTAGGRYYMSISTKRPESVHKFTVSCEDYGAYSKLEALASGCRQLMRVGADIVVETNGRDHIVDLPKDVLENQIADGYPPERARSPRSDEDRDGQPRGNGVEGDGLSAYEEYRGFFTKGTHTRTSWDRKDLFIRNRHNLDISKFNASELALHEIDHEEWETSSRLINYSHGHAHVVDQHALLLVEDNSLGSGLLGRTDMWLLETLMFQMGPPKNVNKVRINVANHKIAAWILDTVAHELGHAVSMWHHGDPLVYANWQRYVTQAQGSVWDYLPGPRTVVVTSPKLCDRDLPRWMTFGSKQNQASGSVDCIMRYNYWAEVYEEEGNTLSCAKPEPPMTIFCDSPAGTGYNANNRCAGNAAEGRGNCKGQILVNDK